MFGGILTVGITNKLINGKGKLLNELPILIYGLAILVSGLYSTKPIEAGIECSQLESQIHSYSATLAGIAFPLEFHFAYSHQHQAGKKKKELASTIILL